MNFQNLPPIYSDWVIESEIGKGSFGSVYKIKRSDDEFTEYAALKVLTIPNTNELDSLRASYNDETVRLYLKDNLAKIKKEYAMMAKMKGCVNVVHCEDIQSVPRDDGFSWDIFIKMELLASHTKWVPAKYSEQIAIRMADDICNALKWCERFNVIHRDIKPENIFVSEDGNFKLGDFGIAKNMEGTSNATIAGTYAYMAPEVYNSQSYNARADIYSLGMALYWLLNEKTGPFLKIGVIPSYDQKMNSWMRRLGGEPLPPPKNGSDELKQIVLKACAFRPEDRYQTAREMQDALRSIGRMAPPPSVPPMHPPQSVRPGPINFGETVVLPGPDDPNGGTVVLPGPNDPNGGTVVLPDSYNVGRKQKQKKKSKVGWVIALVLLLVVGAVAFFMLGDPHLVCDWTEANCTDPQTCRVCGKTKGQPLGHVWGEAACGQFIPCVNCGLASDVMQDHAWSEPTCQTPATCTRCDKKSDEYAEHSWIDATCVKAKYCAACGLEQGNKLEHNWIDATCTAPQTCADCQTTTGTTTEHNWSVATCVAAATCVNCGENSGTYGEHSWLEATCTVPQTCSVCQSTTGEAPGHSWTTNPDTGLKVCAVCGVDKQYCTLNYNEITLNPGGYFNLKMTDPDGKEVDVQWTESKNFVSIIGSRITAIAVGDTVVTAEYEGETYQCVIRVRLENAVIQQTISAGANFTIAVKKDGTVMITETNGAPKYDVSGWRNIVSVCAAESFVVGLQKDGRVALAGNLNDELKKALNWTNIVAIDAGKTHIVGLKSDGTVVVAGSSSYADVTAVGSWRDIVAVAAGAHHTVGLRSNGTVVTTAAPKYPNDKGQCSTSDWNNIVAICATASYTVGLKADGTAVATGFNGVGQCDVQGWTDVVAISAFHACTMGLKKDGTVVITNGVSESQRQVGGWKDIVAISVGYSHTVALKADGTVVATGGTNQGGVFTESDGCKVTSWKSIQIPPKPWWWD